MKHLLFVTLIVGLILTGCVQQSQHRLILTPISTAASTPTPVAALTPTPIPTLSAADKLAAWNAITANITSRVGQVSGVKSVQFVRLDGQVLDIQLQTKWRSAGSQPLVSYEVIRQLSWLCSVSLEQKILDATGVRSPTIRIITTSAEDSYVFLSQTSFQQCHAVYTGDLNFKDWQSQSGLAQTD
jgi:hypothetical protein